MITERLARIEAAVTKIEAAIVGAPKPWPELLCLSDLSRASGIPLKTIYSMVRSADLKAVRLGKSLWVTRETFVEFIAAREAEEYEPYRSEGGDGDEGEDPEALESEEGHE